MLKGNIIYNIIFKVTIKVIFTESGTAARVCVHYDFTRCIHEILNTIAFLLSFYLFIFFIRNLNFLRQQNVFFPLCNASRLAAGGARVWFFSIIYLYIRLARKVTILKPKLGQTFFYFYYYRYFNRIYGY